MAELGKRLLGPGLVLTMDQPPGVIPDGAVLVDGSRIAAVGRYGELAAAAPGAERVDAQGMLITPGLVNAHDHFYGFFARGIALEDPPPRTFRQILERLWWRLDKALTLEAVYYSALLGALDALKAGVTTVIDHHASPNAIRGSLDRIAAALRELGLRGCLAYEVSDRDGPERAREGLRARPWRLAPQPATVQVLGRIATSGFWGTAPWRWVLITEIASSGT